MKSIAVSRSGCTLYSVVALPMLYLVLCRSTSSRQYSHGRLKMFLYVVVSSKGRSVVVVVVVVVVDR